MYIGIPNPNILMPLEKMRITNLDKPQNPATPNPVEVLYNPQSYTQARGVSYAQIPVMGADAPIVQFQHGGGEVLSFDLFFDSLSAGGEVGGGMVNRLKFTANSLLPSAGNQIDVRKYTDRIYKLMQTEGKAHRPPLLKVEWSSLQFKGFLAGCTQQFLKFDESGMPVRAVLKCQFIQQADLNKMFGMNPLGSPDTTKFRTVRQGDSLWALAAKEYGEPGQWREIARANGIVNARQLRTGDTLVLPALKDETIV